MRQSDSHPVLISSGEIEIVLAPNNFRTRAKVSVIQAAGHSKNPIFTQDNSRAVVVIGEKGTNGNYEWKFF